MIFTVNQKAVNYSRNMHILASLQLRTRFRLELAQGDLLVLLALQWQRGRGSGVENCCFVVVALDTESVTFY